MRRVWWALALGLSTPVAAQKPDDDATLRWSVKGIALAEIVPLVVAAFADQQITVSAIYETSHAATIVAGPFPHDPARLTTIRVSTWLEGDSIALAVGGYFVLMQQDIVPLKR